MASANAYLAPKRGSSLASGASTHRLPHRRLKYWFAASIAAPLLLTVASSALRDLALAFSLLGVVFAAVHAVVMFAWIRATWALLSPRAQGDVSPGEAAGYIFVPFFNLYWAFALNRRIARGQEAALRRRRTALSPPTVLAWLAPTLSLVSCAVVVVVALAASSAAPDGRDALPATMLLPLWQLVPFVWFFWMARVDRGFEEILYLRELKRASRRRLSDKDGDDDEDDEDSAAPMKKPRPRKYER